MTREGVAANALEEGARAAKAVERELDYLGLVLAGFAPHGFDSSRVGDYLFADDMRGAIDRLKAAWLQVALVSDGIHRDNEAMQSHLRALGRPDLIGEPFDG